MPTSPCYCTRRKRQRTWPASSYWRSSSWVPPSSAFRYQIVSRKQRVILRQGRQTSRSMSSVRPTIYGYCWSKDENKVLFNPDWIQSHLTSIPVMWWLILLTPSNPGSNVDIQPGHESPDSCCQGWGRPHDWDPNLLCVLQEAHCMANHHGSNISMDWVHHSSWRRWGQTTVCTKQHGLVYSEEKMKKVFLLNFLQIHACRRT